MKPTRPILRYHGGKWKLAPWIISHFPKHRVYVEAFGGGASVLLRKRRSYAEVYNDLDGEIVNLFRVLRDHREALAAAVGCTPFARDEYVLSREASEDPVEQARRTVVRSMMGFSSSLVCKTGFRSDSHRSNTTPAKDWANLPPAILMIADRFRGVIIENKLAAAVKQQHDAPTTLHYDDPPYVQASRVNAEKGYAHEMTDEQHCELAAVNGGLKGMVIVSGYPSDLYSEIYEGWNAVSREAFGDGNCKRTEVLWFNDAAWKALHDESLFGAKHGNGDTDVAA